MRSRILKYIFVFFLLLGGIFIFLYFDIPSFSSTPHPTASYQEALELFSKIEQEEALLPLSSGGPSRLLTHGEKTERVFVLLHGLSDCPEQDLALGKILFDTGANVIIPRAKYAGFANLLNTIQGEQTGQDLLNQAAVGLDIAAGLGKKTTLITISASALAGAWMAQHRSGIETVLLINPFFGPYKKSVLLTNILTTLLLRLPNFYLWKNNQLQAALQGPPYVYPRWGTYCLASTLSLARAVRAFREPIQCDQLTVLITADDHTTNNHLTKKITHRWKRENPEKITLYEFPITLHIPHDCLTLYGSDIPAIKEFVYPEILKLVHIEQ